MRILGKYKIEYSCGIVQYKNLISATEYNNVIVPKQRRIYFLEGRKFKKLAREIKAEIRSLFGDNWFTNVSPIYSAISNGFLNLPVDQGGSKKCKVILI